MRRRRRRMMVAWLLGGALFALGWVIYGEASELWSDPDIRAESTAAPDPPTSVSLSPSITMPSRESLAVILERPVFSETRRPIEERGSTQTTPSDFRLAGVVIAGTQRSALIQSGTGAVLQRLKEGDDIGGWTVVEIALDRINIRRGAIETELLLDYAAPAPPTPRTESRKDKTPVQSAMKEAPRQVPKQPESAETGSEGEVQ